MMNHNYLPAFLLFIICASNACVQIPRHQAQSPNMMFRPCGCKNNKFREPKRQGKKMDCHRINIVDMFANAEFPQDIDLLSVDLRDNDVKEISKNTFGDKPLTLEILKQVIKLDISNNKISKIAPKSFSIFTSLTRLNLSANSIGHLSADMFSGMPNLEVLDLSLNIFPIIPGDAFTTLPKLRKLYLRSTDFVCNCLMHDFKDWIDTRDPVIRVFGTCHLPMNLRGRSLRSLTPDRFICDANNTLSSLPYFEMTPDVSQLVFEGDQLIIQCEGTNLPTSKIYWSFNRTMVDLDDESISIANAAVNKYHPIITGSLRIQNITSKHSGNWSCMVSSKHGSESRVVRIMVISHNSTYCSRNVVDNNRGKFVWDSTISGITKAIKCPLSNGMGGGINKAYRSCPNGLWESGNYDQCPYKNKATRLIYNSLQDLTSRNVVSLVRDLISNLDLLRSPIPITEPLTVQLIAKLIERLSDIMIKKEESGENILGLASYAMNANASILREAQKISGACDKILLGVRSYALKRKYSTEFSDASENIAVSRFMMESKSQYNKEGNGLRCRVSTALKNFKFECKTSQFKGQGMQSFVSLPKTILDSCGDSPTGQYKLYFIAYRNGSLFQEKYRHISDNTINETTENLDSAIVSQNMVLETGVSGCNISNLSDPINFSFKTIHPGMHVPAIWSQDHGWVKDDRCVASPQRLNRNFTFVRCNQLSVVTLLFDPTAVFDPFNPWALSNLAHPAVFAGTGILIVCLIAVITSYICCSSKLKISSASRHMLVNICAHMLLVSCAFALGIWRVDYQAMCLACGIVLHYASLSILLWIMISVKNIHRELDIQNRPPSAEPKPPRAMLMFYLIGCGIPTGICGITAATKIQNYSGDEGKFRKYCWLSWETSVFAFYLPAALIAFVCVVLLIRVLCALNQHVSNPNSPRSPLAHSAWQGNTRFANGGDRYQAICNRNLDDDTSARYTPQASNAIISSSRGFQTPRSNEQSFKTQLCGVALLFVFFLLTWVAAALSVAAPSMQEKIAYEDQYGAEIMDFVDYAYWQQSSSSASWQESDLSEIFSYIYAVLAIIMGVFLVLQHLLCRRDIRSSWGYICSSCARARKGYRHNSDLQSQGTPAPPNIDSENFDVPGDQANDIITTGNDKTSTPRANKKKPQHQMYTDKTDPTTMETIFNSTTLGDEPVTHNGSACLRHTTGENGSIPPVNEFQNLYENGHFACIDHQVERAAKSITSVHSDCMIKQSDHALNSSFRVHSQNRVHVHHPHSHDHCMAMNSRNYIPDPHHYQHHGFHNHHTGHNGHSHHQHNKPVKMTNLHVAHDASMTEHSFDELGNNMHTIPVVMQHHTQPKMVNTMFYNRYQRTRKALEHKRAKQKKLNVLREYAQDPLTSNEDLSQKGGNINESSPLIQSPEKTLNWNGTENNEQQCKGVNNGDNQSGSKYRTLLIHSPSNKKHDTQKLYSRPGGPNRRLKRMDANGQQRHLRGLGTGDKNASQPTKRAKQNMRRSHNSTLSERERDTTSSEKSRSHINTSLNQAQNGALIKEEGSLQSKIMGENINQPSPIPQRMVDSSKPDNHGYLTLQQLQNANPFVLYNNQPESLPLNAKQNLEHDIINNANEVDHKGIINSEESEEDLDIILSSHDDTQVEEEDFVSGQSFQLRGSSNTVESHSVPLRNETSV